LKKVFKIPLNPVRWRNLSNGVNPPLGKGDLLGGRCLEKSESSSIAPFEKGKSTLYPPLKKGG